MQLKRKINSQQGVMLWSVFCLLFLLLISLSAFATDQGFVETSEDIVNQLTQPNEFGASRSFVVVEGRIRAITVRLKDKGKELEKEVQIQEDSQTGVARLKVEFDVNSDRLRSESYEILDQLAVALADVRVSDQQVCIKGHTDSDGSDAYNRQLSFKRAEAVRGYVTGKHDLLGADLFVVGYGEQIPLIANTTPANKQMNRRVEITLGCPEVQ